MAFSLTLFGGIPFWHFLIRLMLFMLSPLLYPDQNPFAKSSFPSTQSPPTSCDASSMFHWLNFIATMGSSEFS
jgi:hypothetical protein